MNNCGRMMEEMMRECEWMCAGLSMNVDACLRSIQGYIVGIVRVSTVLEEV